MSCTTNMFIINFQCFQYDNCNSRSSACSTYTCDHTLTSLYSRAKQLKCHRILSAIDSHSKYNVNIQSSLHYRSLKKPRINNEPVVSLLKQLPLPALISSQHFIIFSKAT